MLQQLNAKVTRTYINVACGIDDGVISAFVHTASIHNATVHSLEIPVCG